MNFVKKTSALSVVLAGLAAASQAQGALIAHWSLDANATSTTGSHNGTVINAGVTFGQAGANPFTGLSTAFTGTGHIDVPYSAALNPTSFTATMWVNPTATGGNFRSPLTSRDDAPGGTFGYIVYNEASSNWSFWTGDGDAGWDEQDSTAVVLNQWTHIAISYNAATSTKSLYLNGALVQSTTTQQYVPNGPQSEGLHIGAGADDGTQFNWAGNIDDVAVFNTALSAADIQKIKSAGVTNFVNNVTPVVVTPISVTSNAAGGPDFFPAVNLINGSGLSATPTIDNILAVTHNTSSINTNSWVTQDPAPGGGDFFAQTTDKPTLTFNLGGKFDLTDLVLWNYGVLGNAGEDFTLEFSLDGGAFGNALFFTAPQASGPAHLIDLGGTFRADMVRLTFTDNYFGFGGGGDRVGLNEIRFLGAVVVPEPATASLAMLGLAGLMLRRRRMA